MRGSLFCSRFLPSLLIVAAFALAESVEAQPWSLALSPSNTCFAMAVSANGSHLAVVGMAQAVLVSTNYGATWSQKPTPIQVSSVATSADGESILAGGGDGAGEGPLLSSFDGGDTWSSNSVAQEGWKSVATSANGSNLFALSQYFHRLVYSTNTGATWHSNAVPMGAWQVLCSADGRKLAVSAMNTQIFTSTNYGVTWVTNAILGEGVTMSADGSRMATWLDNGLFTSLDGGKTWSTNSLPVNASFYVLAGSGDGNTLLLAAQTDLEYGDGPLYTSHDFGGTWISNALPPLECVPFCSYDGNFAVALNGAVSNAIDTSHIWTQQTPPMPTLAITQEATNLALSWGVPSASFVLQESADLTLAAWQNITNPPALNLTNLHERVSLPIFQTNAFFRLKSL